MVGANAWLCALSMHFNAVTSHFLLGKHDRLIV
jgi:hypothetical protein